MRRFVVVLAGCVLFSSAVAGDGVQRETKWVRDSAEYYALTTQVYRQAETAVMAQLGGLKKSTWAVVLDVDETALDNSPYMLESAAYGRDFAWPSWNAWVARRAAEAVPGVNDFVASVRTAGGRVVWVTNRHVDTQAATRDNLKKVGLYADGDLLCLLTDDDAYTKAARRAELRAGEGSCSYPGKKLEVAAYVGDSIADFPEDGEDGASRFAMFGERFFIVPNPQYGGWVDKVTRPME